MTEEKKFYIELDERQLERFEQLSDYITKDELDLKLIEFAERQKRRAARMHKVDKWINKFLPFLK